MTRDIFVQAVLTFLKVPYKWGGDDPTGFDCSGLVQELLAMRGLDPAGDQTAQSLYDHFKSRSIEAPLGTGALVFYGPSVSRINHVAMVLDGETIIEAGGGGSKTNTPEDAAQQNAFVRLRPINHRLDLVAVLTPKGM